MSAAGSPEIVIRPSPGWKAIGAAELWRYRELLYFLVWRDVKSRYKQTALGAAWAVIQPLFGMIVFTLFFGRVAKIPSNGLPYSLFAYAALLPWTYFSNAVTNGTASLVGNSNLVTKVYFPRLIIPGAAVIGGLVDSAIALVVVLPLMARHRIVPPVSAIVALPLLYVLAASLALGVSLWLTALNVRFRDVKNAVPFLLQLWMFATPVVYPLSLVPARYRWLAALNPMAGVVEGFRNALFSRPPDAASLAVSAAAAILLVVSGALFFRRVERTFADVV